MRIRINGLFALALLAGGVPISAGAATAGAQAQANGVDHVVIVWLDDAHKTDADRAALIAGGEMLRTIPGLVSLSIGRAVPSDRPVVDASFDVAFHFKFANLADMQAYVSHPTHMAFLKQHTAGRVAKIIVYDSQ